MKPLGFTRYRYAKEIGIVSLWVIQITRYKKSITADTV